jgi:hypothetical protein
MTSAGISHFAGDVKGSGCGIVAFGNAAQGTTVVVKAPADQHLSVLQQRCCMHM